jgi:hypothetical protein
MRRSVIAGRLIMRRVDVFASVQGRSHAVRDREKALRQVWMDR